MLVCNVAIKTYWNFERFCEALETCAFNDHFRLSEEVFMEACSKVQAEPDFARKVADAATILLLMSNESDEVTGLIHVANQLVEEQDAVHGQQE